MIDDMWKWIDAYTSNDRSRDSIANDSFVMFMSFLLVAVVVAVFVLEFVEIVVVRRGGVDSIL